MRKKAAMMYLTTIDKGGGWVTLFEGDLVLDQSRLVYNFDTPIPDTVEKLSVRITYEANTPGVATSIITDYTYPAILTRKEVSLGNYVYVDDTNGQQVLVVKVGSTGSAYAYVSSLSNINVILSRATATSTQYLKITKVEYLPS